MKITRRNKYTKTTQNQIAEIIPDNDSNIDIIDCYIDEYNTVVALICGGLNGSGHWSNYYSAITNLVITLEDIFDDVWTILLDVDCLDDVFYLYLGVNKIH